jgi:hypothetical protein
VKLRVLSGTSPHALEIAEVRVLESARDGYTPLFVRAPMVKNWKGSPREAAQRGLDWLQHAAPVWAIQNKCFGCHVQAQALMGQAVAVKQGYRCEHAVRGVFSTRPRATRIPGARGRRGRRRTPLAAWAWPTPPTFLTLATTKACVERAGLIRRACSSIRRYARGRTKRRWRLHGRIGMGEGGATHPPGPIHVDG